MPAPAYGLTLFSSPPDLRLPVGRRKGQQVWWGKRGVYYHVRYAKKKKEGIYI